MSPRDILLQNCCCYLCHPSLLLFDIWQHWLSILLVGLKHSYLPKISLGLNFFRRSILTRVEVPEAHWLDFVIIMNTFFSWLYIHPSGVHNLCERQFNIKLSRRHTCKLNHRKHQPQNRPGSICFLEPGSTGASIAFQLIRNMQPLKPRLPCLQTESLTADCAWL